MASPWTLSFVSKSFFLLLPLSVAAPSCLFLPAVGSLQILRASRGGKRDWFAAPQSFTFANLLASLLFPTPLSLDALVSTSSKIRSSTGDGSTYLPKRFCKRY